MKQSFLMMGLFLLVSCQSDKEPKVEVTNESANVVYPLPSIYNDTWEIGDPKNTVTVLQLGKDWMAGNLDAVKASLADSVSIYLSTGDQIIGSRDSVMAQLTALRKMFSEISFSTHSFISLKHRDSKENWVSIWGKEVTTSTEGKKDSVEMNESWQLNDGGKIQLVYQYGATIKPAKK